MTEPGRLFLVPAPLGNGDPLRILSPEVVDTIRGLRHFVVESERSALRLLSGILPPESLRESSFSVLDEHTDPREVPRLLEPARAGHDLGMLSEGGCPCVADPGADLAAEAHRRGIRVIPLAGPSAILQALMASGFSGQRFEFLGYLPARAEERRSSLKRLEREAARDGATRIFIEAPYRGRALLSDALDVLDPETRLCVAASLGGPEERIRSLEIRAWRTADFRLEKELAVFLLAVSGEPGVLIGRPSGTVRGSANAVPVPAAAGTPGRRRDGRRKPDRERPSRNPGDA